MLSDQRVIDVLGHDLAALAALPDAALTAPVAACPGWSVTDLVAHLGRVHHRALRLLEGMAFVPLDEWEDTPIGEAAVPWARDVARALATAVATVDPDAETHTWLGPRPARFWLRRMMQETSIHRWDAQAACGDADPVPADVGADGVDELLTVFCPRLDPEAWAAIGADPDQPAIHLHATDTAGEWTLHFGPDGMAVTPAHGKAAAAVKGGGAALDLLVWNRIDRGAPELECFGDAALVDRFLAVARF